jgi:PAS domain S-box-containing protein
VARLRVPALVANNTGAYVMANRAAAIMTGYEVNELQRMSVWDLVAAPDERETDVLWRTFVRFREQTGTIRLKTKRGRIVRARYVAKANVLPGFHLSLLRKLGR